MSTVAADHLPLPIPLSQTPVSARPHDDPGSLDRDAWQRALVSASRQSVAGADAASVAAASRLLELNAVIAAPAAELVLQPAMRTTAAPSAAAPHDAAASLSTTLGAMSMRTSNVRSTAPDPLQAGLHEVAWNGRPTASDPVAGGTSVSPSKAPGRSALRERRGDAAVRSRDGASDPAPPAVLVRATAHGGPEQALAAYAQAMSTRPTSPDAAASFTLVSRSSIAPVRVHVQWRGRMADVWIGLHRRAFDQLPDIRAGIEDWVSSRGGVVSRLVCNGERLSGAPLSSSFQGVL